MKDENDSSEGSDDDYYGEDDESEMEELHRKERD
jgi:hypothetical protein